MHTLDSVQNTLQHMQLQLQAAGLSLRPVPPVPTSCCGRGCNGCVWEGYYDACNFWLEDAKALLAAHT